MMLPPSHTAIVLFAVALILVTWVVRWWFPVDDWLPLCFVLPAEPANLTQYLSLFALGILAIRNDWFQRIQLRTGLVWPGVGQVPQQPSTRSRHPTTPCSGSTRSRSLSDGSCPLKVLGDRLCRSPSDGAEQPDLLQPPGALLSSGGLHAGQHSAPNRAEPAMP